MSLEQKQTDLEALERASALVAEWVFDAHENEEADEFVSFRDKCVGILGVFEPHVRKLEAEVDSLKASISKMVDDGEPEELLNPPSDIPLSDVDTGDLLGVPTVKDPTPKPDATKGKMKPDAQKILDDLMNKVTGKSSSKGKYPMTTVKEDLPAELKKQLRSICDANVETLNSDVLEQMSGEFGVSKLRIAEYFGWLQR